MNRIDKKFKELKKNKKKAFIAFITAGYPSLSITEKLIYEFDKIGVDILELGVPFSDPMADGSIIQEASYEALKRKTHLIDILKLVKKVRSKIKTPICLMTYYNPIFCFPQAKFVEIAKDSGVDGVIIPDLPPEEGTLLNQQTQKAGIHLVYFLSPTSSLNRIKLISRIAKGFIYYVSLTGTTGARSSLAKDIKKNIKLIKKYTRNPVCVGFGISTRFQVRQICKVADGVIIGSVIVKRIKENLSNPNLVRKVSSFVSALKA